MKITHLTNININSGLATTTSFNKWNHFYFKLESQLLNENLIIQSVNLLFNKLNVAENKDSYNIIASSHYLGTTSMPININSPSFVERLEMIYNNNLKIVIISEDISKLTSTKIGDSISNDYMVLNIPFDLFFSTDTIEKVLIKKSINLFLHLKIEIMQRLFLI
jgi:hypothetical protein